MSIYATMLSLADDEHEEGCAVWVEDPPGSSCFQLSGKPCDCGRPRAPLVYEGSHVLPSETDRRGGSLDVAMIPAHITRDGRDDGREGDLKDWLRISVDNEESSNETWKGEPYVPAGSGVIVLARRHVEELRDVLTGWLERDEDSL